DVLRFLKVNWRTYGPIYAGVALRSMATFGRGRVAADVLFAHLWMGCFRKCPGDRCRAVDDFPLRALGGGLSGGTFSQKGLSRCQRPRESYFESRRAADLHSVSADAVAWAGARPV